MLTSQKKTDYQTNKRKMANQITYEITFYIPNDSRKYSYTGLKENFRKEHPMASRCVMNPIIESTGLDWIKKNQDILNPSGINERLTKKYKFPKGALIKELNGTQSLSKRWYECINKFVSALQENN